MTIAASLLVRGVHVLSMAVLFGGSALLWALLRADGPTVAAEPLLEIAATYERLFWAGAGLLVVTGVGNLGALAPAIPGPGTGWGLTLALKLAAVVLLLVGSLVRTLAVALQARVRPDDAPVARLRAAYAATAVYLLVVVALGEVLAHG